MLGNIRPIKSTRSPFLLFLFLLGIKGVFPQSTNQTVFAFPDYNASVGPTARKIFTTTISVTSSNATFNESLFINAVSSFYAREYTATSTVNITSSTFSSTGQGNVTYEVSYNFNEFTTVADTSNDTQIALKIGAIPAVKAGLETDTDFSSVYTVQATSTDVFSFTGNLICLSAICNSSNVFCIESSLGLSPMCRSVCMSSFVCNNGGACVHQDRTRSPLCHCPGQSSAWLIGGRCEYEIRDWMIAVFVLGYFGLIFLIILIGYCCCKKRKKTKPMKIKKTNEDPVIPKNNTNNDISVSSPSHTAARPQDEFTFEHDTNPKPRSTLNRAPLETVIESSSESNESSQDPGFYEESSPRHVEEALIHEVTRPTEAAAVRTDTSGHESSSSSDSETESNPEYSAVNPEIPPRRYDSLQFSSRGPSEQGPSPYEDVQEERGDKETQTNTRINIELPESILMQPI